MGDTVVELDAVSKSFGSVVAVSQCSLVVEAGEFVSLLGPSGSGKTTLLRMIAGFETPTSGAISIRGRWATEVPPKDRGISMVFQNYALFPHMSVYENVAFGLSVRRLDAGVIRRRVGEFLDLVQLEGHEERFPRQLSGGQQQRVALARALITEPAVLLLDEPLGALDRKLREELQVELKDLLQRLAITSIYVTHDQDEALVMSDRVAVMNGGEIEQVDSPEALYHRPRTAFVASFVGTSTLLEGTLVSDGNALVFDVGGQEFRLDAGRSDATGPITAAIRPENVRVRAADGDPGAGSLRGHIVKVRFLGASTQYRIQLADGQSVLAAVPSGARHTDVQDGAAVEVELAPEHLHFLERDAAAAHAVDERKVREVA